MSRPLLLSLLLLSPSVDAQGTLVEVTRGEPGKQLMASWSNARCLAHTENGDLWLLVLSRDPHGDGSGDQLRLCRSPDGGISWPDSYPVPTPRASVGSLVAEARSDRLHLAWCARGGNGYLSVFYQVFDADQRVWLGEPEQLADGRSANDQYNVRNVEVTPKGTVVVGFTCHRTARAPFRSNWSLGALVREAGAADWSGMIQVNPGSTGVAGDVQANGEVVHFTYRSGTEGYGVYHRALDTESMELTRERPVSVRKDESLQSSNTSSLLIDFDGGRYALYCVGAPDRGGKGALELAYAGSDEGPWVRMKVADDPSLQGGNHNRHHFSLARGPGSQVFAIYSKVGDGHRTLYQRVYDRGASVGEERVVASGDRRAAYRFVTGVRDTQGSGTVFAAISGTAPDATRDRLVLYGLRWPVRRFWR